LCSGIIAGAWDTWGAPMHSFAIIKRDVCDFGRQRGSVCPFLQPFGEILQSSNNRESKG
jgi:hypothetical protein